MNLKTKVGFLCILDISFASSPVWWHMPVIPAAWEAAVGGSLRSSRLLCAMSIGCLVLLTAWPLSYSCSPALP
uniref:Uncharacterized protein n=1 Tax=Chelydra serpentina TaxID=8475 RepID=A0A8C3XLA0_CHESE